MKILKIGADVMVGLRGADAVMGHGGDCTIVLYCILAKTNLKDLKAQRSWKHLLGIAKSIDYREWRRNAYSAPFYSVVIHLFDVSESTSSLL